MLLKSLRNVFSRKAGAFAMSLAVAGVLAVGVATPTITSGQDMFCETDPPIPVTAPDGTSFIVNLNYYAYNRILGELVTPSALVAFIEQNEEHNVNAVTIENGNYKVVINARVKDVPDSAAFGTYADLTYFPSGRVSQMEHAQSGEWMKITLEIPMNEVLQGGW